MSVLCVFSVVAVCRLELMPAPSGNSLLVLREAHYQNPPANSGQSHSALHSTTVLCSSVIHTNIHPSLHCRRASSSLPPLSYECPPTTIVIPAKRTTEGNEGERERWKACPALDAAAAGPFYNTNECRRTDAALVTSRAPVEAGTAGRGPASKMRLSLAAAALVGDAVLLFAPTPAGAAAIGDALWFEPSTQW